jgi:hypothetical protein
MSKGGEFSIPITGENWVPLDKRIADLCTPVFAFMFCKQADPRLHHRGYSLVVVDARILPSQAYERQVFRGHLYFEHMRSKSVPIKNGIGVNSGTYGRWGCMQNYFD